MAPWRAARCVRRRHQSLAMEALGNQSHEASGPRIYPKRSDNLGLTRVPEQLASSCSATRLDSKPSWFISGSEGQQVTSSCYTTYRADSAEAADQVRGDELASQDRMDSLDFWGFGTASCVGDGNGDDRGLSDGGFRESRWVFASADF